MGMCWGQFGWKDASVEVLKELLAVEVREMLEAIVWIRGQYGRNGARRWRQSLSWRC